MKKSLFIVLIGLLFILGLVSCGKDSATPLTIKDCAEVSPPDGAETILIPGGTFKMGSVESNDDTEEDEFPEHIVTLGCYSIYKEEVSNSQYQACVDAGLCLPVTVNDQNMTRRYPNSYYADYPVVGLDYNMAAAYCEWVGGRLPSEAEWEYAATSNKDFIFPWGKNDPDCEKAEFAGCHDPAETSATGLLTDGDSPFEISDMAGNAWEWVFDWYSSSYYSISPSTNPYGPINGVKKVVRGGAYNSDLHMLLSANRHAGDPYHPYSNVGFRCVFGALDLPDNYQQPDPGTHGTPKGDDDPVDDDDPQDDPNDGKWLHISSNPVDCPDGNGDLHFRITIDSNNVLWGFVGARLEGDDIYCGQYDAASHSYICNASEPAVTPEPSWHVEATFNIYDQNAQLIGQYIANLLYDKPQACNLHNGPLSAWVSVGCPENGFVKVDFTFNPVITWVVKRNSAGDDLDCVMNNPHHMVCKAPDVLDNGKYHFHLEGTYNGDPYVSDLTSDPAQDCGESIEKRIDMGVTCWPDANTSDVLLTLMVFYQPIDYPPPQLVVFGGEEVSCDQFGDGILTCPIPQSYANIPGVLAISCFGNGTDCYQDDLDVPVACEEPADQAQLEAMPICSNGTPTVMVAYDPPEAVPHVELNSGIDLDCQDATPNIALCPIPDYLIGINVHMMATIQGGEMKVDDFVVPVCGAEDDLLMSFQCEGETPALVVIFSPPDADVTAKMGGDDLYCAGGNPGVLHCVIPDSMIGTSQETEVCVNGNCESQTIQVESCLGDELFAYEFCDSDVIKLGITHDPAEGFVDSVKIDGNPLDCFDQDDTTHICTVPPEFAGQTKPVKVCKGIECDSLSVTFSDCDAADDLGQNQCKIYDVTCISATQISFLMDVYDKDTLEGVPIEEGSSTAYMGNHHFDYVCANIPNVDGRIYCSGPFPGYAQFGIRVDFTLADSGEDRWCGLDVDDWNDLLPGCAGQGTTPNCTAIKDPNTCLATQGCSLIPESGGFVCKNE